MASEPRAVLRLTDVVKTFPGVVALGGVSLEVVEGEVHALLGENGAGKSTLMAVAAGALTPDSGSIEIGRQPLDEPTPARAQALGLSVVYQHTSVIDDLTVAENLLYCVPAARRADEGSSAWVQKQLDTVGAEFDPGVRVSDLAIAQRQLVEIAKALALQPKVLVLDEPTEALTAVETERLFQQIVRIKALGTAVVYISHRLPEVRRVADRISILRDGQFRGTFSAAGVSEEDILARIIGRSISQAYPAKTTRVDGAATPALIARNIRGDRLQGIDVEVWPGEVLGLAGVEGNGQRDFIRGLAGLTPVTGEITIRGTSVATSDPVAAQKSGIIFLPGDRHAEGLLLSLSIRENLTVLVLDTLTRLGLVSREKELTLAGSYGASLAIKAPSPETTIAHLSGGNQQKVLFGRSMAANPAVFLADEPTRGVDAGARIELYRITREVAVKGAGVVVLSSDAVELQGLCDRVLVFSRGKIVRSLVGDELTEENITGAAIGAETHRKSSKGRAGSNWLGRFAASDFAPILILAALIILLGLYTTSVNPKFLSERSLGGTLLLASALAFVSFGQLFVLMTGGIDLSVGPLTGLVVVVLSFFADANHGPADFALGLVVAFAVAAAVGLINGLLVRIVKFSPLITTLAMFIALQGVSLSLRSTPDGFFRRGITQTLNFRYGFLPAAFIVVVIVAVGLEIMLRKTRFGMGVRAIGSNEVAAYRLGARVDRTATLAYVLCSLFAAAGGVLLAAQVGVGDPTVGQNYTLQSISAVVLGGASIFGGRGSFLGALAAVLFIQEITATTGFLGLDTAWQYWLPGLLILVATALYSRSRVGPEAH